MACLTSAAVGLFGGTFDPVHHAHLRLAVEMRETLGLRELRLIPCHVPALRGAPGASPAQRRTMLELGIGGEPGLLVDDRELRRAGPSYTVETLAELRRELGPTVPLVWLLGLDAFAGLPRWQRWTELTAFAHLAVLARPGAALPQDAPLQSFIAAHRCEAAVALTRPSGGLWFQPASRLEISATAIRTAIAAGRSVRYWLPDAVEAFIRREGLYCPPAPSTRLETTCCN